MIYHVREGPNTHASLLIESSHRVNWKNLRVSVVAFNYLPLLFRNKLIVFAQG